jgi:2-polyprenyl-3-methyl-5-hydroxy-6-metoxy-1,4-benzoquinol methylase
LQEHFGSSLAFPLPPPINRATGVTKSSIFTLLCRKEVQEDHSSARAHRLNRGPPSAGVVENRDQRCGANAVVQLACYASQMTTPSPHLVSAAAHEFVPHANPLSVDQMGALIAEVASRRTSTAIDIGCGPGSFSVGLASCAAVNIRAVDLNGAFLERARHDASQTALLGSIDFQERALLADEGAQFDVVVCVGSSGAIGKPVEAIQRCKQLMTATGTLVFADLVWTRQPPEAFLSFLGVEASDHWHQEDGGCVFQRIGLTVEHELEASEASWQAYENAVFAGRLRFADSLPAEKAAAVRNRAKTWFAMYELHGHSCLGFVAYLARQAKPL